MEGYDHPRHQEHWASVVARPVTVVALQHLRKSDSMIAEAATTRDCLEVSPRQCTDAPGTDSKMRWNKLNNPRRFRPYVEPDKTLVQP